MCLCASVVLELLDKEMRGGRNDKADFTRVWILHQVMELARILFEGICSRALMQSQKEALKGLEFQNQIAFGKPPAAPVAGKKSASAAQVAFGYVVLTPAGSLLSL